LTGRHAASENGRRNEDAPTIVHILTATLLLWGYPHRHVNHSCDPDACG
jgi:hypothetical protein